MEETPTSWMPSFLPCLRLCKLDKSLLNSLKCRTRNATTAFHAHTHRLVVFSSAFFRTLTSPSSPQEHKALPSGLQRTHTTAPMWADTWVVKTGRRAATASNSASHEGLKVGFGRPRARRNSNTRREKELPVDNGIDGNREEPGLFARSMYQMPAQNPREFEKPVKICFLSLLELQAAEHPFFDGSEEIYCTLFPVRTPWAKHTAPRGENNTSSLLAAYVCVPSLPIPSSRERAAISKFFFVKRTKAGVDPCWTVWPVLGWVGLGWRFGCSGSLGHLQSLLAAARPATRHQWVVP